MRTRGQGECPCTLPWDVGRARAARSFYESAQPQFACSRWFGRAVQESVVVPIEVTWDGPTQLHVTAEGYVGWRLTLASSPMTRAMSAMGAGMPLAARRSTPTGIFAMGRVFIGAAS